MHMNFLYLKDKYQLSCCAKMWSDKKYMLIKTVKLLIAFLQLHRKLVGKVIHYRI